MRLISENNELFEECTSHLFSVKETRTFREQLLRLVSQVFSTDFVSLLYFRHDKPEVYSLPGDFQPDLGVAPRHEDVSQQKIFSGNREWPHYLAPLKRQGIRLLVLMPVFHNRNGAVLLGWKHKQEIAFEEQAEIKPLNDRLDELLSFYDLLEQNQQLRKSKKSELPDQNHQQLPREKDIEGAMPGSSLAELLFSSLSGLIFLLDQEGTILKVNSKAENTLGYTTPEIAQMQLLQLFQVADRPLVKKMMEVAWSTGYASMENRVLSKNGIVLSFAFSFYSFQSGNQRLLLLQGADISHSKQMEGSLRKISNHLRHIINSDILCYIKWNKDFEILDWSVKSAQTFGWTLQEVKGEHILHFTFLHPEEKARVAEVIEKFKKGEQDSSMHELKHLTKNERELEVEWYTTAIKDEEGNITSYLSLGNDITERKRMEQDLLETNQKLHTILASSPVSIVAFDEAARVQSWNNAAQRIFGYSQEEVLGKEAPYLPNGQKAAFRKMIKEVKEGETIKDWVLSMRHKDNTELLVKVNAAPLKDVEGNISGFIAVQEDVTEQERLREGLNEERLFRESILQNLQTLVIACDAWGSVNLYNSAARAYMKVSAEGGMPDKLEEAYDLYSADGRHKVQREEMPLLRALEGEVVRNEELVMITQEGIARVFSCNANMIRDSRGNTTGALLSMEDITEKKESLREFVGEKEFSDAILSSLPGIFYVINKDGRFVRWNRRFEQICQYTQEEIGQLNALDLIAAEDSEKVAAALEDVFEKGESRVEASFLTKTGKKIPYLFTGHSFKKNGEDYLVGMGIDISERRAAEESRERIINLLEATSDFVGVYNRNKDCLYLNAEGKSSCGISDLKDFSLYDCCPDWMRDKIDYLILPQAEVNGMWRGEATLLDKKGKEIPVSLVLIAHHSNGDKYYSMIARDISHRKSYEKKLTEQNQELKKINAELDRFVYSASHDLRAPLVSILGLINIARLSLNPVEFPQYLDLMENRVSRLDTFIQDIEDFSRNSRLSVKHEPIDFNALIEESRENLKFTKGAEKVSMLKEIQVNAAFFSDKSRLMIIMNNLISNAIRYSNLNRKDAYIKVVVEADHEKAVIKVEDNGQGIAPEYQHKIFDMFFRASTSNVGSGLGLFIVKETLEKLGGSISVESSLGEFTVFTIQIPNLEPETSRKDLQV